jgi:hypothetical protein
MCLHKSGFMASFNPSIYKEEHYAGNKNSKEAVYLLPDHCGNDHDTAQHTCFSECAEASGKGSRLQCFYADDK